MGCCFTKTKPKAPEIVPMDKEAFKFSRLKVSRKAKLPLPSKMPDFSLLISHDDWVIPIKINPHYCDDTFLIPNDKKPYVEL